MLTQKIYECKKIYLRFKKKKFDFSVTVVKMLRITGFVKNNLFGRELHSPKSPLHRVPAVYSYDRTRCKGRTNIVHPSMWFVMYLAFPLCAHSKLEFHH